MYGKPMSPEPAEPKFNGCGGGVTLPCALLLPPTSGLSLRSEKKEVESGVRFKRVGVSSTNVYAIMCGL